MNLLLSFISFFAISIFGIKESVAEQNKHSTLPDYYQRDSEYGGFPLGGISYCGPVSTGNVLYSLALNGFSAICDVTAEPKRDQYDLIKNIGSSRYIDTAPSGCGPKEICRGLKKYLQDRGQKEFSITHQGWRPPQREFRKGKVPSIRDFDKINLTHSGAIVNLGWYRYDKKKDTYTRKGGHWVTFKSLSYDKKGQLVLVVHDPETRNRVEDSFVLEMINSGELDGDYPGLPFEAAGFYAFKMGKDRYGIVDGVIKLTFDNPTIVTAESNQ